MTQRQYVYISKNNDNDAAVLLSTSKAFYSKEIALIYLIEDDKYFLYKTSKQGDDMVLLRNEYEVMCKYNEYFKFREDKFWEFINIIKDIKARKEPKCQIEFLNY